MNEFLKWLGKNNMDTMLADLSAEQFRAVWTTYCLVFGLFPDTYEYDNKLLEISENYGLFGIKTYHKFDLFMGALLC